MAARERVLVVDDERDMAESCAFFLERAGYSAAVAESGEAALEYLADEPCSVVITDLKMPRMSGLMLLAEIKAKDPDVEVLVITGHPEVETAVQAMQAGALDYITKPFTEQAFLARVEKALAHHEVRAANKGLRERLRRGTSGRRLVYRSRVFSAVVDTLETRCALGRIGGAGGGERHRQGGAGPSPARPERALRTTVRAVGLHDDPREPGRERAVRPREGRLQRRRAFPPGSFAGCRPGHVVLRRGGQPADVDPAEAAARDPGGSGAASRCPGIRNRRRADRVCATNRPLDALVESGEFRHDLFYRLDVVRIEVPPLRERPEDIELIAARFLEEFGEQSPDGPQAFTEEALAAMRVYRWPGNVRQLRNAIERACALGVGEAIGVDDLPPEVVQGHDEVAVPEVSPGESSETFQEMKARKVAAIESAYIERLLRRHEGNVTRCAEEAGVSRSAFQKLMQRYGIKSVDYR